MGDAGVIQLVGFHHVQWNTALPPFGLSWEMSLAITLPHVPQQPLHEQQSLLNAQEKPPLPI